MHLEIHDVKDHGTKLVFKLEYDEEFKVAIAKILGVTTPTKKDIQTFIMKSLEKTINFSDFSS